MRSPARALKFPPFSFSEVSQVFNNSFPDSKARDSASAIVSGEGDYLIPVCAQEKQAPALHKLLLYLSRFNFSLTPKSLYPLYHFIAISPTFWGPFYSRRGWRTRPSPQHLIRGNPAGGYADVFCCVQSIDIWHKIPAAIQPVLRDQRGWGRLGCIPDYRCRDH